ncbi:MAG: hypothetical protein MI920_25470 [Kiloniellales bacterium]|nr:hypothetical protein [Kiloniellales bacterium]
MDIEFHYYMTYLIAAKGGLGVDDAKIVAYASQYIDDNDIIFEVDKGKASAYRNYISQTMNILKPKAKLLRIYPIFHFIPGDPMARTAWRKDGKLHWLNTTPNSQNANRVMDRALASGDLYRIGVACHGYVDTWAHQNFIGYYDEYNAMAGTLSQVTPNIGHADAQHNPDWPALVWRDERLLEERVDNKTRFIEAAVHLLAKLMRYTDPQATDQAVETRSGELATDLDRAIGERDQANDYVAERIARYRQLSAQAAYGDTEIEVYDEDKWLEEAINERVRGLRDKSDSMLTRWDPLTDVYTWKDPDNHRNSHWYRFQEAVKAHQDETWAILEETTFRGLELAEL